MPHRKHFKNTPNSFSVRLLMVNFINMVGNKSLVAFKILKMDLNIQYDGDKIGNIKSMEIKG